MHRSLLVVTMVVSLAASAGCARSGLHSAVPNGTAVSQANDPSWCPPGEDFQINDGHSAAAIKKEERSTEMKPNGAQRPQKGAVHAAVY
jgi:hypothetical protein